MVNFNEKCHFDGKDCCPNPTAIGNGLYNPENDNMFCNFDGGDGCLHQKVNDGFCDLHHLNRMCKFDRSDCFCDFKNFTKDGHCNQANNKSFCLFDLHDCIDCPNSDLIGNGECNQETYNQACNFDGTDCCPLPRSIANGVCDMENMIGMCNYDGGDCCLSDQKNDGTCDQRNNNRICGYDGEDCCTGNKNWIGDNFCDDSTNNPQCHFDGGDCCGENVNTQYCSVCECITQEEISPFDPCPNYTRISDEKCQDENNNLICSYDGGDCCREDIDTSECVSCQCLTQDSDGTDLITQCPDVESIANGFCDESNNKFICQYDGGDCHLKEAKTYCSSFECLDNHKFDPCPEHNHIGDGQCDTDNFNIICSFDGGDCQSR